MLHALGSGWQSLITAYILTAVGLWLGMGRARWNIHRVLAVLVMSVPVMIEFAAIWSFTHGFVSHWPEDLRIASGMVFFVAASA